MAESVVFIDPFEFEGDGVLPEGIAVGLVEFQGMFDIARDFDAEHELYPIDAGFVCVHHQSHLFIVLEEFGSPLPDWVFG